MATQSPLLRAYRALQKEKRKFCNSKSTKTKVKAAASKYVKLAQKAGQTKTEAQKKANRVMTGGCSMSSRVSGTKNRSRKTARKRKTTTRRTR